MSTYFTLASLLLGLLAWTIPILAINKQEQGLLKSPFKFSILSFSACATALCFQFLEIKHQVNQGDLGTLMDTIGTLVGVTIFLVATTIILNTIALSLCYTKKLI